MVLFGITARVIFLTVKRALRPEALGALQLSSSSEWRAGFRPPPSLRRELAPQNEGLCMAKVHQGMNPNNFHIHYIVEALHMHTVYGTITYQTIHVSLYIIYIVYVCVCVYIHIHSHIDTPTHTHKHAPSYTCTHTHAS